LLVGISILSSEDFETVLDSYKDLKYDYLEINLKYFSREYMKRFSNNPAKFVEDSIFEILWLVKFCYDNTSVPIYLKLNRDMPWLISKFFFKLIAEINIDNRIGLIAANSFRYLTPPKKFEHLIKVNDYDYYGAISGLSLLLSTLTMIDQINSISEIPIIASGGIMSGENAINACDLGAKSIQICTAINAYGYDIVTDISTTLNRYWRE
jgi:dihydroorotate dehydrogenase